jgi:hypothetical protein
MRSTDKTFKQLLLNHHKWSWYIPWMIWHGFEGNQWTLCHEADWFFCLKAVESFLSIMLISSHSSWDQMT